MVTSFNIVTDNIESNKFFYLTIYTILTGISFFLNKVGAGIALKDFTISDIPQDLFMLFIITWAIFLFNDMHVLFKGGWGKLLAIFALIPVMALLHPMVSRLLPNTSVKNGRDKYNYMNFESIKWGPGKYALIIFFAIFLYIILAGNFRYETYFQKFTFILVLGMALTFRSLRNNKDMALWPIALLLVLGSPPQHTILNTVMHVSLVPYILNGMRQTSFKIYRDPIKTPTKTAPAVVNEAEIVVSTEEDNTTTEDDTTTTTDKDIISSTSYIRDPSTI